MELLINKAYCEAYFQISIGRSETEFARYIREAQMFDFRQLFPGEFYTDMMAKKTEDKYKAILDAKSYEYNEKPYNHEGLKAVLAHLSYGLYLFKSTLVDTSFGLVTKTNTQSEPASYQERKDLYYYHKEKANQLFDLVVHYIECNIDTYELWGKPDGYFRTKLVTK